MSNPPPDPPRQPGGPADDPADDAGPPPGKSFGNISPAHWSRARSGMNEEALDYYRERSKAPGVAEGGAERNFYCMECDGVIPFAQEARAQEARAQDEPRQCPHCGAGLDEGARRYFNWVELDSPPRSDAQALLPLFGALALAVAILILLAVWLFA